MNPNDPNSINKFFGIKVSKDGIPVNKASDKQLIYKDDYSTKTYYDATNSRMLEGLLPDGSYGLWVSTPGIDVTTADPDVPGQLIFNSNQNVFKIAKKIITTIPSFPITVAGGGGVTILTFPHGLSFTPIIDAYVTAQLLAADSFTFLTSSYVRLPVYISGDLNSYAFPATSGSLFALDILTAVDNMNVYIQANCGSASSDTILSIPLTVFMLQETAS